MAPGVEISSLNHVGGPPAVIDLPPRVNGGDSRPDELVGPPRDPEEGEEGGGREGDRRSRDRRRKKGRGRRKRKRSGEPEVDAELATVHNHIQHSTPEAVPVAGATQVGVANLPPPTPVYRIVGDGTRGPEAPPLVSSQQTASRRGGGRGRKGSVSNFRMVRIKQEPVDDEQGRDIFHFQFIPTHTHTHTHTPQVLLHTHTVHVL